MSPLRRALALVVPPATLLSAGLSAQGVTTAGIQGVVAGTDSAGIPTRAYRDQRRDRRAVADRHGHAGPLRTRVPLRRAARTTIEARAIGFTPVGARGITLSLGERHRVDLVLSSAVAQLAELTVTAEHDRD